MSDNSPKPILIKKKFSLSEQIPASEKVSVKFSTIYRATEWEFLIKKQETKKDGDELMMWLDELSAEGWILISSQPSHLGLFIFKRADS